MNLTRASGTANTFFIIDQTSPELVLEFQKKFKLSREEFVKLVCNGKLGFSADGAVFLEQVAVESSEYRWDFYNKDGSVAEMCGNAARAVGLFVKQQFHLNKISLQTLAGKLSCDLSGDFPKITMPKIESLPQDKLLKLGDKEVSGKFINTGVPHFVIGLDRLDWSSSALAQLRPLAANLRRHPDFGKGGSNITYVDKGQDGVFRTISFERGVEDFTQSCGTGAVAAAIVSYYRQQLASKQIQLAVPGGELSVDLSHPQSPVLTGETKIDFNIQFYGS